jgi:hypothetical protein
MRVRRSALPQAINLSIMAMVLRLPDYGTEGNSSIGCQTMRVVESVVRLRSVGAP